MRVNDDRFVVLWVHNYSSHNFLVFADVINPVNSSRAAQHHFLVEYQVLSETASSYGGKMDGE